MQHLCIPILTGLSDTPTQLQVIAIIALMCCGALLRCVSFFKFLLAGEVLIWSSSI